MKKIVSLLVIVTILLTTFNINVYANTGSDTVGILSGVVNDFVSLLTPSEQQTVQLFGHFLNDSGLINDLANSGDITIDLATRIINSWASALDAQQAEATTQENIACIKEAVVGMVDTSDPNNVVITDAFKTALINAGNEYTDSFRCYVHTSNIRDVSILFPSVLAFNKWTDKMNTEYSDSQRYIFCYYKLNNWIGVWDLDNHPYFVVYKRNNVVLANPINIIPFDGLNGRIFSDYDIRYKFDGTDWVEDTNSTQYMSANPTYCLLDLDSTFSVPNNAGNYIFNKDRVGLRFFDNQQSITVSSILTQPYYYNNSVWNDFRTSSGGFTYNPKTVNTISYGDALNYINSFNTDNGYPPSVPDININIENIDNENKQPSGGGSGSGGDDSGDDDPTNIFGWLKQLGKVLGDLIKGLGEFLTEFVTGLVAALTNLLSGIGDLISNITETLPSAFMDWFSSLFQWMPEEWKALLSASLVFMVLYGIIKVIRG